MLKELILATAATALAATPALARDRHHRSHHQGYVWYQPNAFNWYSPFGDAAGQRYWLSPYGYWGGNYWGDYRRRGDWDDDDHRWRWRGERDGHHWRRHGDDDDQGEDNDDQGEDEDD